MASMYPSLMRITLILIMTITFSASLFVSHQAQAIIVGGSPSTSITAARIQHNNRNHGSKHHGVLYTQGEQARTLPEKREKQPRSSLEVIPKKKKGWNRLVFWKKPPIVHSEQL